MNQNGYQQYKTQSINTMTKAEMLILLYDELIKRLTRAEIALKNENFTEFDAAVTRSEKSLIIYPVHWIENMQLAKNYIECMNIFNMN